MQRLTYFFSNSMIGPFFAGVLLITAPGSAQADEAAPAAEARTVADFDGTYRYVGGETEQARAYQAVDEIVENLNFVIRGLARKMLRKPTTAKAETSIQIEGDKMTIAGGVGKHSVTLTIDGPGIDYRGDDGKTYRMSVKFRQGALVQRIVGHNSTTTRVLKLTGDGGKLKIKTTISHPMMHKPLEYKFSYKRA